MSVSFSYGDRRDAWTTIVLDDAVRLGEWSVSMGAQLGGIQSSSIILDDPTGDIGHDADQIKGLKTFTVWEDEAPADNQVLFFGYIHDREYESAGSLITGESVKITVNLADVNDEARYYLIPGDDAASGDRPAETIGERLTWLIASTYINLVDSGLVVYPTTMMDAHNYANQTGADVLDDCAQATGYNWFIYIHEADFLASLFFDNANTSTAYSSDLRISSVPTDVDSTVIGGDGTTHTWAPLAFPRLTRSPQTVAALVRFGWSKGTVSVSRSATADEFGRIDTFTADSNVTSATQATRRANRILRESATEEDTIDVSLQLPRANVNDVREGQRMQAKFRQLPGYKDDFSWFRVLKRTVGQADKTSEFYTVNLTLSPQATSNGIVQTTTERHQLYSTFASDTTVGNLLLYVATWRQLLTGPTSPDDGETWTLLGQGDFVDDHDAPDPCAVTAYATIVTTPKTAYLKGVATGGSSNGTISHSVMYELSGVALSDLVTLTSGPNAPATDYDIGTVGDCSLAFGGWGNGWDGFFTSSSGVQTTTHADWTTDFYASRDYDGTTDVLFGAGFPFTYYGHVVDGASIEAETIVSDDQTPHHWGGVVVYVP